MMIDYSDGKRAGTQAGLQFLTAPKDVRDELLAKLPSAKQEMRTLAEQGNEQQRGAAAYWLEFYEAFDASIAAAAGR
jgi:hypothetical protein